jgi:hypothetical protein
MGAGNGSPAPLGEDPDYIKRLLEAEAADKAADNIDPAIYRPMSSEPCRLEVLPHSLVTPENVRWLWRHRIPLASLTLLAGRQGLGKSTLVAHLAACVTRGQLTGHLNGTPSPVLLISYEDHPATTINPRLRAADADLDLVYQLSVERHDDLANELVTLPSDLGDLERIAHRLEARLLVIDPVVVSLPGSIDAHRDQDVRRALAPLASFAERCGLAVLGLIHWNKGATTDALTRISGSTAFTASARSVLAFGTSCQEDDETGRRVLAHAKTNLGPKARSVEYQLEPAVVPQPGFVIDTVRIVHRGESDVSPAQLLAAGGEAEASKVDEACAFLRDALEDGKWHSKDDVKRAAASERIPLRTLMRAVNKLGVEFERRGFPAKAQWRLPPVVPTLFEG